MQPYEVLENPGLDQMMEVKLFKPMGGDTSVRLKEFNIIIVGVGGTGGYVVRDLQRFIYSLGKRVHDIKLNLHLVDPDIVEMKNLLRQNFSPTDLGKPKAEVTAIRTSRIFGLEVKAHVTKITANLIETITRDSRMADSSDSEIGTIVVGCVDNNSARRDIHKWIVKQPAYSYWIDSGNEKRSGQVVMGDHFEVPVITQLYPEILDESQDSVSTTSCADHLMEDEQNIFVNTTAANVVFNFLRTVILFEETHIFGVRFNINNLMTPYCLKKLEQKF